MKYFTGLIILILMYSCVSKNQEIVRAKNGNIILKCELKNGVRDGKCYEYYPNGTIWVISNWVLDVQDGEAIEYFENGKEKIRSYFINNYRMQDEFYDEDGRLLKEHHYITVNHQTKLNGMVIFDTANTDKYPDNINIQETRHAQIFADRDTVGYDSFVEYEVKWMCSDDYYVSAFTGNIDYNFNLIDSTSLKGVDLENKNRFYPSNLGTDTLRVIFRFRKDGESFAFRSYLEKVFTVREKNEDK